MGVTLAGSAPTCAVPTVMLHPEAMSRLPIV